MKTLRLTSNGPEVELLQLALKRAGYYTGKLDGSFGPLTQAAVLRFQTAQGLTRDGVVGAITWGRLMPYITGYTTHMIKRGDTLNALARRYGTSIQAILTANPSLTDAASLRVGQVIRIPLGFDVVPTNISYTSELLGLIIEGLKTRYPFIGTGSIGTSVMGSPLHRLTIGTGDNKVTFNASHHANEWITTPVLMKYLEQYAKAVSLGGSIAGTAAKELYEKTTLDMIPMVNPDGVDLVNGFLTAGNPYYENAKAMNKPSVPFPSGWKANINGVDLNLNYPAEWERAKQIKYAQGYTSPGPRDFVGPEPLSEPESRAMYAFTQSAEYRLVMAYHAQGEVIYWKFMDYNPPQSREIGEVFSRLSGYLLDVTPEESGYAGYKDWFIQQYNRPGYTIEVGMGENPLPISQFDKIYMDNVGMLTAALMI
ncbi:MAG: M14 family zinc carboxypeptidase [Eubacteriales bacterium]